MTMPDFLTVAEAAQVLRIGRTAAYALAARYEQTGGAEGLPVIRIGKQLRVPRARLEELAGGALLATPCESSAVPRARVGGQLDARELL